MGGEMFSPSATNGRASIVTGLKMPHEYRTTEMYGSSSLQRACGRAAQHATSPAPRITSRLIFSARSA